MTDTKLAFAASGSPGSLQAFEELTALHENHDPADADVIVPLGGDGFVLHCLHEYIDLGKPIYGMNRGTVGFLLNEYSPDDLQQRIASAKEEPLHPLTMTATTVDGEVVHAHAFNEVSLLRSTRQSANLRILVDGEEAIDKLIADGVLVATAAGSTAYNLSAHGPVIPVGSDLMALTPISAFRPRRWRGALLSHSSTVRLENLDPKKRPLAASADHTEVANIETIEVSQVASKTVRMLFDEGHSLNERILREQFTI